MTPFYHTTLYTGPEGMDMCKKFFADPESKHRVFPLQVTTVFKELMEGLVEDMVRSGWLPTPAEIDRRVAACQAMQAKRGACA